ncbi:orotate phosphoribosyltransferase [Putridiphycobacter roseus]|uniref:Orotate phosphoribosyltransferase n=1 Tax=Putridiphycobacter roseus TaxID=2219161 RepID=A0A2W1NBU0_9FLAO|nr:orotate phosphoribosyltransferase [Putridiphycobacter roseus]PZE16795.1 orotate phosphoribosyltransferase [Putridiphycobacter roseus]
MILNKDKALKVAEFLLQIKAVKLQPQNPFTWSSGWQSPIYCDNRKILSHPKVRTYIRQVFVETIIEKYGKPDVIAGVATGGIAIGALIAEEMGLPFIYVRSSAKAHGMQNQIEGDYSAGQQVIVIEDLISTGGSSLKAVDALRAADMTIKGLVAVFTYNFQQAIDNFKAANCDYTVLTDYEHLINQAIAENYITVNDKDSLTEWRLNPEKWKADVN